MQTQLLGMDGLPKCHQQMPLMLSTSRITAPMPCSGIAISMEFKKVQEMDLDAA